MILSRPDPTIAVRALKSAAPYIRMYKNKVFVIKASGAVFSDEASTRGLRANQPSRNCFSHARSQTSWTARAAKCSWHGRAPGTSKRAWPRVVQRCIIAVVTSGWN